MNGWYVFENGEVHGPYDGKQLVARNLSADTTSDVFVSKQGFSRWYPIEKLADMISSTNKMDENTNAELRQLEELVSLKLKALSGLADQSSRKAGKSATSSRLSNKVVANQVASPAPARPKTSSGIALADQPMTRPSEPLVSRSASMIAALPPQPMNYRYFIMRARLRLGAHKNAFLLGCFVMPLTLCLYWLVWYREAMREIVWHSHNTRANPTGLPLWFVAIPVIHVYMTYCLAAMIQRAEHQNQYSVTSPVLAAFLSLFPPFAVMYLQSALNKHWDLHVRSMNL